MFLQPKKISKKIEKKVSLTTTKHNKKHEGEKEKMAKSNEKEWRLSQGMGVFLVIAVLVAIIGVSSGWFAPTTPTGQVTAPPTDRAPLQLIPAIEKTNVYLSIYDQQEFDRNGQKDWQEGTASIIKSGVLIDPVTTLTTNAAESNVLLNGGDKIRVLANAAGFYAKGTGEIEIKETLQPIEVFLDNQGTPDVYLVDHNNNEVSTMTLMMNEVSRQHSIVVERPGDRSVYQFCGVAAQFDSNEVEPRLKVGGSYVAGETSLENKFGYFDELGYDAVWTFDQTIKNFDELRVDFLVGTKSNRVPTTGSELVLTVFDCEEVFRGGEIVKSHELSSTQYAGLTPIDLTITFS